MWACKILLTKPFRVVFVKIICAVVMLTRTFNSAVRGYHYYRRYWSPIIEKRLVGFHEETTPSTPLPSNHTKKIVKLLLTLRFMLDRGARMSAVLTSNHYQRSPLVQGSMAIVCKVAVEMSLTLKNTQLLDRLIELVKSVYGHLPCQRHLSLSHFWLMRLGFNLY